MFKFKSIKKAILFIVLPLVILSMSALSFVSYFNSKSIINSEISKKMDYQIGYLTEKISNQLKSHSKVSDALAKSVESIPQNSTSETYNILIEKFAGLNSELFGTGIWFEPFAHDSTLKYFGPYGYKENNSVKIIMDYSTPEYDYFKYDWYTSPKNTGSVHWSNPYFDKTLGVTMLTVSSPFYVNNNFSGVITADLKLDSIQTLISDTRVGNTGYAFLLSSDGSYLAHKDKNKVMKDNITNDPNSKLAFFSSNILKNKKGHLSFTDKKEQYELYFSTIPESKFILCLVISTKELYSSLTDLIIKIALIFIVSISIVAICIFLYTNSLSKTLARLKEAAILLASGDFRNKCDIHTKDEIGVLASSFNTMIDNIKALLQDTKNVSSELSNSSSVLTLTAKETSTSSDEIARTVNEIADGSEKQALDAEEGVKITLSLNNKFTLLDKNSKEMQDNAAIVIKANNSGILVVDDLIKKTDENNKSMINIENAINNLNLKANNIDSILDTITSISEQTNLLALNASIEAARAGESGRGFAVVADEIRKLAEGSSMSTDKIKHIVDELQRESLNTVRIMEEVKTRTLEQTSSVNNVNDTFKDISSSIQIITSGMKESSEQQVNSLIKDKDLIIESIENISAVCQETAAASEEVSASVEEQSFAIRKVSDNAEVLNNLSQDLDKLIDKFKI